ncbi:MAG: hypothetical protein ACLGHX_12500 [Acidimicrobiia bacterium]
MAHRGRVRVVVLAAMVSATLLPLVARADLLGGVTEVVDDTSDTTTDAVDSTVDTTETVVDSTVGDSGTVVGEPVDDLTDTADETSDLLDTVATPDPDSSPGSTTTTTTLSGPTTTTTLAPALTSDDVEAPDDEADATAGSGGGAGDGQDGASGADGLTVLSAAGGLTDLTVLEPVSIEAIADESFYARLLSWLSGAGTGLLGLLAGPLLALEILLRALLSAGSGLVAPASLLVSYLVRLVWETRRRQPAVPA